MGNGIRFFVAVALAMLATSLSARAGDVWITPDLPYLEFDVGGNFYVIERNQDNDARIVDEFAKTSRPCPPHCIQPMSVADGVETTGEVELLDFIQDYVEPGTGFLVDARLASFYKAGTIPGAVNLPFNMFVASDNNPFLDQLLSLLGVSRDSAGAYDFTDAKMLMLFCNGPFCGQAPIEIHNLLNLGYPADHLKYYRGGMQAWASFGLSVILP